MSRRGLRCVLGVALVVATAAGCGPAINVPAFSPGEIARLQQDSEEVRQQGYRIEAGDTLVIKYAYHPEMDQETVVRPDGKITVPGFGSVAVGGQTPPDVVKELKELTSARLRNPEIVVNVQKFSDRPVFVGGEVGKPGSQIYRRGLTPLQAIIAAGGFLASARIDSVILVRASTPGGQYLARKLDLGVVVNDGEKEPIELAPHDVIFVPRTPIANANIWVRQHVTDLFPFIKLSPTGF